MPSLSVSVTHDLDKLSKSLTNLQKEQLPYATARALTLTAWNARIFAQDGMVRDLEKVKAFTLNAFQIKGATKKSQTASIQLKPIQMEYLSWAIAGGRKESRGSKGIGVPWARARMTPNAYRKWVARDDTFIGEVKGLTALWQRIGRYKVKLLIAFEESVDYHPNTWRYYDDVSRAIEQRFPYHWNEAMTQALASAR